VKKQINIYTFLLITCIIIIFLFTIIFEDNAYIYQPDNILQDPSNQHIFGTDNMGRDFFIRVMHGSKNTLLLALIVTSINIFIGFLFGTFSGYIGGILDSIFMRIVDAFLSIPNFLIAISLLGIFGGGLFNLILFLSLTGWCNLARIVRNEVIVIKNEDYILANKVFGYSSFRNLFYHIIPSIFSVLSFYFISLFIGEIYSIVSINFLGLGISAEIPELGNIISDSKIFLLSKPYLLLFPVIIIFIFSFLLHILSDELRDYFDRKKSLIDYSKFIDFLFINNNFENE
jgi:ABC-type dipeptide/oligopeptide/nickel transport system permease subunit